MAACLTLDHNRSTLLPGSNVKKTFVGRTQVQNQAGWGQRWRRCEDLAQLAERRFYTRFLSARERGSKDMLSLDLIRNV